MKEDIDLLFDLLRADGSVVINKKLARGIGIQPAIMYSELLSKHKYFKDRYMLKDGWFFNSIENMRKGTCLSEYQQRESIGKLREMGLIEYKLNGMPATRYFKIVKSGKLYEILKSETAPQTSSEEIKELNLKNLRTYPKKLRGNNNNLNNTNNNKIFFNPLTGEWENIRKEDRADWHTINPDCNIDVELVKMKQWILDDSRRQRKNYRSFIVNWLSKDNKRERLKVAKNDFVTPNTMVDLRKELAKDDIIKPRD